MSESTLICTLGGQPQIVTFALDYLLARAEAIREVFVLHLDPPDGRVATALDRLLVEFEGDTYCGRPCRFRPMALRQGAQVLPHVRTEAEAEIVRQTVFTLITELKRAGRTLHMSIAGGPRMMGLMALSAATLYCGHQDKIWHIYTEPHFMKQAKDGAIMHDDRGDRVRLIQVPIVPWGAYLPQIFGASHGPAEMMNQQTAWMDHIEHRRCRDVWHELTERERDVVRAFAKGMTPQEVAEQLVVTVKTVSAHTTSIFSKCRPAWELPDKERLTFYFLRDKFRDFVDTV
ncbi:MAG: histidine kinase [Anaerolineae bacterium]|nr:histidine kinase [Anaerolineae bacterium]